MGCRSGDGRWRGRGGRRLGWRRVSFGGRGLRGGGGKAEGKGEGERALVG